MKLEKNVCLASYSERLPSISGTGGSFLKTKKKKKVYNSKKTQSPYMKTQTTWRPTWRPKLHEDPDYMRSQTTWGPKLHKVPDYMRSQTTWGPKLHEVPDYMRSQTTWGPRLHEQGDAPSQLQWARNDKHVGHLLMLLTLWWELLHLTLKLKFYVTFTGVYYTSNIFHRV